MERRVYPKPPIIEAIMELRFVSGVDAAVLLESLSGALAESYSGERREGLRFEVQAQIQDEQVASSARQIPSVTFLSSSDGLRLVGCADNLLTVHVLAPYPGWESFVAQAHEVVEALPVSVKEAGLRAIGVRYLDRIKLPDGLQDSPNEYLTVLPQRPTAMPPNLTSYVFQTQSQDDDQRVMAVINCSLSGAGEDGTLIGLDLNLVCQRDLEPLSKNTWKLVVEGLHQRQREIFEEAITDKMRDLFV
jgi:uncharacterized protein (TIGR04255 family)